jgi:ankyrin repeat protein
MPESFALRMLNAFRQGDFSTLEETLKGHPGSPNSILPSSFLGVADFLLEGAIYNSSLSFIRTLLEEKGVAPDYPAQDGFPSLLAALSADRPDTYELIELLLKSRADVQQRGLNDYTPLHWAAAYKDIRLMKLLLAYGADPEARTNIDDYATPLEELEYAGRGNSENAMFLKELAARK